jgi:hypothetical protein
VAVGRDLVDGDLLSEGAPQSPALASQPPAGLVHVQPPGSPQRAQELVVGQLRASAVRVRIASTLPVAIRAPNSSSQSSTVSRRETRLRIASVAIAACKRGPNAVPVTSSGSAPVRSAPQPGQRAR